MIKKILGWFGKKKKHSFELAFEFKGHKFYMPETPGELESTRAIGFWQSVREFTLKILVSDLDILEKRMKEAINNSDLATLGFLVNTMSAYRQIEASNRTLLNVGQHFIFIDNEVNEGLTPENKALKERLFNEHEEVRAFFLSNIWTLMTSLLNLSEDTEIVDYLNQEGVQKIEKTFSSLILESGI